MKHVPISILAIIAIVGLAAMLSFAPFGIGPLAVRFVGPPGQQEGNTYVVPLENGEFLSNEITSLSDRQLSRLQGGRIHARDGATDYSQILTFSEFGLFNGGQLTFGSTEEGKTSDFLVFDDSIFKLQVLFASGLRSEIENNKLPGLEDESFSLMGDQYSILDTRVNTEANSITLKLYGGFGAVEFTDGNYADDQFYPGAKINGNYIDSNVRIRASETNDEISISSIEYLLNAHPARGGSVEVPQLHCVRNQLKDPEGMLSPDFDICYKGPSTQSMASLENEVFVRPLGDSQYIIVAPNTRGQIYKIPLAQMPGTYGNRNRDFVFVEAAAGAPNINMGDYFLVNSRNDISGSSNVLRYDQLADNTVYFEDLAGSMRAAQFDPANGEGTLLVGEGTYRFAVTGTDLAIDQTNDGQINGGEAHFILLGGSKLDFGPGFTITHTTPARLFSNPAGDENTQFDVTFNGQVDLDVPSPQGSTFVLKSAGGGIKQGMTRYGTLFTWKKESGSDSLHISTGTTQSSSSSGGVFITLERPKLVKTPAVCGDNVVNGKESCDPPGSKCLGTKLFERGTCAKDCNTCVTS